MAQFWAPASCPANRAFLRFRAMGRMVRSTGLLSISIRPSVRNRFRPCQYLAMYLRASPVGDLAETWPRLGRDLGAALGQPTLECFQLWLCALNAGRKAGVGGLAFDIGLDPVDGGYQFQTFLRNRSSTGFGHVMEFTARMRPAIGKLHVLTGAL